MEVTVAVEGAGTANEFSRDYRYRYSSVAPFFDSVKLRGGVGHAYSAKVKVGD